MEKKAKSSASASAASKASKAKTKSEAVTEECVKRLDMMGLPLLARSYALHKRLFCSADGSLRELTEEEKGFVQKFEKDSKCTVFTLVSSSTSLGVMTSMLYVSSYVSDWPAERDDLEVQLYNGVPTMFPMAMVYNDDIEDMGSIGVVVLRCGALLRTC